MEEARTLLKRAATKLTKKERTLGLGIKVRLEKSETENESQIGENSEIGHSQTNKSDIEGARALLERAATKLTEQARMLRIDGRIVRRSKTWTHLRTQAHTSAHARTQIQTYIIYLLISVLIN
jgi:hypothetical protein